MLIEIWPHIMRRISINKNNDTANKGKIKFMNLHLLWLYLSLYIIMQSPFITYMNSLSFKQLTQFFGIIKSIILLLQQLTLFFVVVVVSTTFHSFSLIFFHISWIFLLKIWGMLMIICLCLWFSLLLNFKPSSTTSVINEE